MMQMWNMMGGKVVKSPPPQSNGRCTFSEAQHLLKMKLHPMGIDSLALLSPRRQTATQIGWITTRQRDTTAPTESLTERAPGSGR